MNLNLSSWFNLLVGMVDVVLVGNDFGLFGFFFVQPLYNSFDLCSSSSLLSRGLF